MSLPSLRPPKTKYRNNCGKLANTQECMILTLKNKVKLVISADSYHCLINEGHYYYCVVCNTKMVSDLKENHKNTAEHLNLLKTHPYLEQLSENLIRQISENHCYCTICSTMISFSKMLHHTYSDEHLEKLHRAILKAEAYNTSDIKTEVNNNK